MSSTFLSSSSSLPPSSPALSRLFSLLCSPSTLSLSPSLPRLPFVLLSSFFLLPFLSPFKTLPFSHFLRQYSTHNSITITEIVFLYPPSQKHEKTTKKIFCFGRNSRAKNSLLVLGEVSLFKYFIFYLTTTEKKYARRED